MPTKDIEEPLLQNESAGERKSKKKLCCFILFSTLIVIIVLLVFSLIVLLIKISKAETTNSNEPGNSANLHSDNMTTNKSFCRILTGQNNDSNIIGDGNIYLTKETQNVTEREACIVESVLRQSPDRNVYIIDLNYSKNDSFNSTNKRFDYISYLLKLYKNLHVLTLNKEEFFKYTDFEKVDSWNKSTVLATKLITAYKFGGVVLSLNFIMMNRNTLKCHNQVLIDENVLVTPTKCDNFIDYLMKSLSICNQNDVEKHTVSSIIRESYDLYCDPSWNNDCKHLKLLHADQFCNHINENCDFLRLNHFSKLPMKMIQEELPTYCRQVVKIYLQDQMSRKEVEDDLAKVKLEIMQSKTSLPEC